VHGLEVQDEIREPVAVLILPVPLAVLLRHASGTEEH
jgi:hypothetical protein